jgi:hypothetical protein
MKIKYNKNNYNNKKNNTKFKKIKKKMVDYNTPKLPNNKNNLIDLSIDPFSSIFKSQYTKKFLIEITPYENLQEIKHDQNFLEILKFTVNKIRKKYNTNDIKTSIPIQNEIFDCIENLRKFQKFSKKIFEATFKSIVNSLKILIDKIENETILILIFTLFYEAFSDNYKDEVNWFNNFYEFFLIYYGNENKKLADLSKKILLIFVEKKFHMEILVNMINNLFYLGDSEDNFISNLIKLFIENISIEDLRVFDFNELLNTIDEEIINDDTKENFKGMFDMIIAKLKTDVNCIMGLLIPENREFLNILLN